MEVMDYEQRARDLCKCGKGVADERLRLAAMILNELTESDTPTLHDEIAAYAAANAGSKADLDGELEAAGVEHLSALNRAE